MSREVKYFNRKSYFMAQLFWIVSKCQEKQDMLTEKKVILWQNVVGLSPGLNCITGARSVTERYLLI